MGAPREAAKAETAPREAAKAEIAAPYQGQSAATAHHERGRVRGDHATVELRISRRQVRRDSATAVNT